MNRETILKYLSGSMTEAEISSFEKRLHEDRQLKKEFDAVKNNMHRMKKYATPETEEAYFVNLMPRVRSKMERKKKALLLPRLSFALTLIIAGYLFIFNNPKSNTELKFDFSVFAIDSIAEEAESYFANPIDEEMIYFYDLENGDESSFISEFDFENVDSELSWYSEFSLPIIDDYELLNDLSSEDFNELKGAIEKIKI